MGRFVSPPDDAMVMQKIRNFCTFQERYIREVEDKLKDWAVQRKKIPSIIKDLKKDGYLDEVRFVKAFISGKFRNNKWGRQKIEFELIIRGIPENLIQQYLATEIDEDQYLATLEKLILSKHSEINQKKDLNVRDKILNFVSGKGYEISLIIDVMKKLKI